MSRPRKITFLFLFACLFSACNRDESTSWDADLLLPLVETELSIEQVIADSLLEVQPGAPLIFRFSKMLSFFPSDSVFKIPDTTISSAFSIPIPVTLPAGFQLYNINDLIRFNLGKARITEAVIEEGDSKLTINNFIGEKVFFDYAIPRASLDGISLNYSGIQIDSSLAGNPSVMIIDTRFNGYRLNLKGDQNNQFNRLKISLNARLNPAGKGVSVSGNKTLISYSTTFTGLKPAYAKGYLGNPYFENTDSIDFSFLQKFEGHIEPEKVQFDFSVENGIGADLGFNIMELKAINSKTGANAALSNPIIGKTQYVSRARDVAQQQKPYTAGKYDFSVSTDNSNIRNLIALLPDRFFYKAGIQINPLGDISSGNDFVYSSSNVNIKVNGEIPLNVSANSLRFTDTLETEALRLSQLDELQAGSFRLVAENGFPFQMKAEIILLDEKKQWIRSFLANEQISPGAVDQNKIVIAPGKSTLEIGYQAVLKSQLERTRYIVLKAAVNSVPQNEFLPLLAGYKLKLKLIGDGIYRVKVR